MDRTSSGALIEYGQWLLKSVANGSAPSEDECRWTRPFLAAMAKDGGVDTSAEPLRSIFSLIEIDGVTSDSRWHRPVRLGSGVSDLDSAPWWKTVSEASEADGAAARVTLYAQFSTAGGLDETNFERFEALMHVYASTLPCTYGEPGVSLYQQWKTVTALVAISGTIERVPTELALVGGDIPGIQRTIGLITSKGAAKGMRGRSAFIQILGYALVRSILQRLDLCSANIVYEAGGNFVLLCGWDDQLEGAIEQIASDANRVLLGGRGNDASGFHGFQGDLSIALAAVPTSLDALSSWQEQDATSPNAWQDSERQLKDSLQDAKARPFGSLALGEGGWEQLFAPEPAATQDHCAVCRRQREPSEQFVPLDLDIPADPLASAQSQCRECLGFRELADSLGRSGDRLLVSQSRPGKAAAWQDALFAISGHWYDVGRRHDDADIAIALDLEDFPAADGSADGFWPMSRTTPMTDDTPPQIKTNEELADNSQGISRLGMLRMDVDDLGSTFVAGLPNRSMMQTGELSRAMERFFASWLKRICRKTDDGRGLVYVLFAGGDDVLALGPWDVMIRLTSAIHSAFADYVGYHPAIHLSAGVALVGEKAPLYAAAEEAHRALDAAKARPASAADQQAKNAVTFLGQTRSWPVFMEHVIPMHEALVKLVGHPEDGGLGVKRSLLATLRSIDQRYRRDRDAGRLDEAPPLPHWLQASATTGVETDVGKTARVHYGPWMWKLVYAISRMKSATGKSRQVEAELDAIQSQLLCGRINDLGLAARWTELYMRKGETNGST